MLIEPKARRNSPPSAVASAVFRLVNCADDELPLAFKELSDWSLPRSDFQHWIPVLNRFDRLLEKAINEYDIKMVQLTPFHDETRQILLAVLRLTKLLWENCANRATYNSTERLIALLHTCDVEVLEITLRLLVVAQQRIQKSKNTKSLLSSTLELSTILAQPFGTKEAGLDLVDLAESCAIAEIDSMNSSSCEDRDDWCVLSYQFYRKVASTKLVSVQTESNSAPAPSGATPSKLRRQDQQSTEGTRTSEGVCSIHYPNVQKEWKGVQDAFAAIVLEHNVPEGIHQFALHHKLRIAFGLADRQSRSLLVRIRLWAISCSASLGGDEHVRTKMLLYEPQLVKKLVQVVESSSSAPMEIQVGAIFAIEYLIRHRSHFSEALAALNASANHGTLLNMLKRVVNGLEFEGAFFNQDYFDALYSLISHVITSQTGLSMVVSAGTIQTITQLIPIRFEQHFKNIAKLVGILDTILQSAVDSFAVFTAARGLELLVERIKDEVVDCVDLGNTVDDIVLETASESAVKELPLDRITYLRSLLKFVMHMMQSSGSLEGLRNLIDSSLPNTIRQIFENSKVFGSSIFGLAVNIMASFIHNEPTSLPIIQEVKLHTAFYAIASSSDLPVSPEVITALPNAFGALCLNQAGLEAFQASNPIHNFLKTLTSEQHISSFQDNEIPNLVGRSVDELIRHHPSLKNEVMSSVMKMIDCVLDFGQALYPDEVHLRNLVFETSANDGAKKEPVFEKKEARISHYIDVIARFLDGLFQNATHCKDFVTLGGVTQLLKLYDLPSIPLDFPTTEKSYALSYILRLCVEANNRVVLPLIISGVLSSLESISGFLNNEGNSSSVMKYVLVKESDADMLAEGNDMLRSLTRMHIYLRLLSDMYGTNMMTHAKSIAAIIQTFSGTMGDRIIPLLGQVYRVCTLENLLLKSAVPANWYVDPPKKSSPVPAADELSRSASLTELSSVDAVALESPFLDYRARNTSVFKQIFIQIPSFLVPLLQGILRLLYTRRLIVDRRVCISITKTIGEVSVQHLKWSRPSICDSDCRAAYFKTIFGVVAALIVDSRSQTTLQTAFANALIKADGLEALIDMSQALWNRILGKASAEVPQKDIDDSQDQLEIILGLFVTLTSGKLLNSSPITPIMQCREKERGQLFEFWDSCDYIVNVRNRSFPHFIEIWNGDHLTVCRSSLTKLVLDVLIHILKSDAEVAVTQSGVSSLATLLSRSAMTVPVIPPDEERVRQLVDMGFPSGAAEVALTRCSNNVARAAEYLLSHPEVVSASYPPRPSAAATAGSSNPTSLNEAADMRHPETESSLSAIPMAQTAASSQPFTTENNGPDTISYNGATGALGVDIASANERNDKGKSTASEDQDPARTAKDILDSLRSEFLSGAVRRCLELMPNWSEVLFGMKELLGVICAKDGVGTVIGPLTDRLQAKMLEFAIPSFSSDKKLFVKEIATGLQFFAILSADPLLSDETVSKSGSFLAPLVNFFCDTPLAAEGGHVSPIWHSAALLAIASFAIVADEPLKYKLNSYDENGVSSVADLPSPVVNFSIESRRRVMLKCIELLRGNPDADTCNAALRMLMCLTRNNDLASEFVKEGGINAIFLPDRVAMFRGQQMVTVSIMRHVIESETVLKAAFLREISSCLSSGLHNRPLDVQTFVKGNAAIVCRNMSLFVESVGELCCISGYEPTHKHHVLALKEPANATELTILKDGMPGVVKTTEVMDEDGTVDSSSTCISFLVNQVLVLKKAFGVNDNIAKDSKCAAMEHIRRGFLLTCLAELVQCFPSCKIDLIRITQKKHSKGTPHKNTKNIFLSYLLTELLPIDVEIAFTPHPDADSETRLAESIWATAVLVGLCTGPGSNDLKEEPQEAISTASDQALVRRSVLESISVAMKDAIASGESISDRYNRFFSLADITFKLLSTQSRVRFDEGAAFIPRIMLEKGFVSLLTSMLSEIDMLHPNASNLIASILKPLESLSKLATRLGRASDITAGAKEPTARQAEPTDRQLEVGIEDLSPMEDLQQIDSLVDIGGPFPSGESNLMSSHQNSEISDIYRNSALGMFNPRESEAEDGDDDDVDEEDDEDEDDDDEDDEDDDGDGLGFAEAEYSDEDEEDDDQSDAEDDMEIVVPHPYHGANEHDDSTDDEEEDDPDSGDDNGIGYEANDAEDEHMREEMIWHADEDANDGSEEDDAGAANEEDAEEDGALDNDNDYESQDNDGDLASEDDRSQMGLGHEIVFDGVLDDRNGDINIGLRHRLPAQFIRRSRGGGNRRNQIEMDIGQNGIDELFTGSRNGLVFNNIYEAILGNRAQGGLSGSPRVLEDVDLVHPLLLNRSQGTSPGSRTYNRNRIAAYQGRVEGELGPLEEFLGGLLGPGRRVANDMIGNLSAEPPVIPSSMQPNNGAGSTTGSPVGTEDQRLNEEVKSIHRVLPMTLVERWGLEGRVFYGNRLPEVALRAVNPILNALVPGGIEDKKNRDRKERELREEEERLAKEKAEEERIAREKLIVEQEEARKKAEEEARNISERDVGMSDAIPLASASSSTEHAMEVSTAASDTVPTQRITVIVGGEEVDITDSGIDPEFLAALPEELQQEVLRDHIREQRQRNRPLLNPANIATNSADMSDFLNALPDDIRDEVVRQQQHREQNHRAGTNRPIVPLDVDPVSFLAALEPALRDSVLIDQDQDFLMAALPPQFAAHANEALRRFAIPRSRGAPERQLGGTHTSHVRRQNRDAVQLVDKPALMTLVRLLFVPEPANKTLLHRLLLNLSENSKSRSELVYLLLSILSDGSADIVAVDKSFSLLSLKTKAKSQASTPKKPPVVAIPISEIAPNLIPHRTIEVLTSLVSHNESVVSYLLNENEKFGTIGKSRLASKKAKGKERAPISSYPVVVLLSLLERPSYLANQGLLEQLVHLIASVFKSIPKEKSIVHLEPSVIPPSEAQEPQSENRLDVSEAANEASSSSLSSSKLKESVVVSPTESTPKIPDHYLRLVVNVLKAGDCSSKTFQSTLSMLQHMGAFSEYKEILHGELLSSATDLGRKVNEDIQYLSDAVVRHGNPLDAGSSSLSKISSSSAAQAKLLRVLKALDFMLSSRNSGKDSSAAEVEKADSASSDVSKNELRDSYDKLEFSYLWQNLGQLLTAISNSKESMVNVATVVLPLIEAFMVIAKPYVKPIGSRPAVLTFQRSRMDLVDLAKDEMFYAFTEEHKKILNDMLRNTPSLMSGSFSLLVVNSKILEFDNKRTYFVQQLHKRSEKEHYGSLQINVRREFVFEDSYHQLHNRSGNEIKFGKLSVRFHGEEGVDAGGVTREWFSVLARQMFNPDYALFKPSAVDKVTYQPNRSSWINPEHLSYFKFVGRAIGKAIYDGRLLDCYFTRSFYKAMLEIPVDWKDIEAIDPEFHKSLEWMLNNDITDIIDLTFSTEIDEFGRQKVVDLKPGGRTIAVTEENKGEYVKLITEQKLVIAIKQQIDAFLEGFFDLIPKDLIKIFNEQELELLISGLPDIDIDDWKNNTEYVNYTASSTVVQWFWRAVRSFSQEERAKMIQFVTGTSKVPLEGFKALEGSNGIQKFQIQKDFSSTTRLPSAHTCFNQIDLPEYDSYEQLRANLLTAISEGGTGFGFA